MTNSFNKLYEVIKTLIAPDGCPWDSVQTPESMKRYLVEETFETLEAIEEGDAEHAIVDDRFMKFWSVHFGADRT